MASPMPSANKEPITTAARNRAMFGGGGAGSNSRQSLSRMGLFRPRRLSRGDSKTWNLRQQVPANGYLMRGIFGEGNADGIAQAIAQQGADADGALDAGIFAFARFGDAQVNRIIPIRAQLIEPGDQKP